MIDRFQSSLKSPIADVASNSQWAAFVASLDVQAPRAISRDGGLGSFAFKYRRLCELGIARAVDKGYEFVAPWSLERFLTNPIKQYAILCLSSTLYCNALQDGALQRPVDASLAGTLAILHCGGRGALQGYPNLFTRTRARFESAQGAF